MTERSPVPDGLQSAGLAVARRAIGALGPLVRVRDLALTVRDAALDGLGLPSASAVETLNARLRSMSNRLEAVEDGVDKLDNDIGQLPGRVRGVLDNESSDAD